MKWPFHRRVPHSGEPLYNRFYLEASHRTHVDSTIVWGTEIDADALKSYLRERNRNSRVVLSTVHALVRAMALALSQFPHLNVRVIGRRLYGYRDINIRLAFLHRGRGQIELMIVTKANRKNIEQIGQEVWDRLIEAGRNEGGLDREIRRIALLPDILFGPLMRIYNFLDRHIPMPSVGRIDALRSSCAVVNDLSFVGAPPLRSYKATRFPDESDSFNLTLGPVEAKVVETKPGQFASVNVMPLFIRADHRIVDAYQLAKFLTVVRDLLNHPERLDAGVDNPPAATVALADPRPMALVPREPDEAAPDSAALAR